MGQVAGGLWERAQGKLQVRRICNKVFDQCAEKDTKDKDTKKLKIDNLHVATLMVYNSVNKQFLSPYKEPPSMETVANKKVEYRSKGTEMIDCEEFYKLIMEWIHRDLRMVLANRVLLALLAAPLLAIQTKRAGRQVPRIQHAVEKVPTPLIASVYSVGLVLLQDVRVD